MKNILKLLFVTGLLSYCQLSNALTLKEYRQNISDNASQMDRLAATLYLRGAASGMEAANEEAKNKFGKQLFCLPSKLAFGEVEILSAIDSWLRTAKDPSFADDYPVETVGLVSMENIYPCK